MTELLQRAIAQIEKLPSKEQDTWAAWLLSELESERRWSELFAESPDLLERLAEEALTEHRAGKTRLLDPDKM